MTAPEEDQRKLRPPYLAIGAAGVVLATLFAIVASLASRTTSEGEPKPVMPGPLTANSSTTSTQTSTTGPVQTSTTTATATTTAAPTTTTTSRKPTTTTTTTTTTQPAPPPPPPPPPPKPPVAKFTSSCTGATCNFDGSGSFDPDGSIVAYSWTFGDGAKDQGSHSRPAHTYTASNTYSVTLTVVDNSGMTSQVTHSVTVTVPPPGG